MLNVTLSNYSQMEVRMAHLIYTTNTSLDGHIEDMDGKFDWTDPSDEVFQFITDLIRGDGTHLYGRRTYESMMVWETDPNLAGQSPLMHNLAQVWQAADKIVSSSTLEAVSTRKTQIKQKLRSRSHSTTKRERRTGYPHRWC